MRREFWALKNGWRRGSGAVQRLRANVGEARQPNPADRARSCPARRVGRPGRRRRHHRYVRPVVDDGYDLVLAASRHPVIERMMPRETSSRTMRGFTEAERVRS